MRICALVLTRATVAVVLVAVLALASIVASFRASTAYAEEPEGIAASDEQLIGTWEIDGEGTLDAMGLTLTSDQHVWLAGQIEGAGLRVVFRRDGTATVSDVGGVSGLPESATWATVSTEALRISVLLFDATQSDALPQTLTIDFRGPNRFVLTIDSQPVPLVMKRATFQPHPITGDPVTLAGETNLYGTWVVDMAAFLAEEAAHMPPEQVAMIQALMQTMQIRFTFVDDGSAVMAQQTSDQSETKFGTWVFETATANTVTFVLTETPVPGAAAEPPQRFTATFQSTNNMTLAPEGDPQVIPFYRE